jgi:glycosyl transferase family 25
MVRMQGLTNTPDIHIQKHSDFNFVQNLGDPLGATGYLIRPSAAQQLLQCSQDIYEPLDHFLEHHQKHGLKTIAIKPYPIYIRGLSSTILDRPDRKPVHGIRKLLRTVFRHIDRLTNPNPWFPK